MKYSETDEVAAHATISPKLIEPYRGHVDLSRAIAILAGSRRFRHAVRQFAPEGMPGGPLRWHAHCWMDAQLSRESDQYVHNAGVR